MKQTLENGQKSHFGPNLGPFGRIWAHLARFRAGTFFFFENPSLSRTEAILKDQNVGPNIPH